MEENKLIAEFMEVHEIMHDGYSEYDFDDNTLDVVHEEELQYHTSWDWLMPVVEKIEFLEEVDDDMSWIGLCTLEGTYNNVVEFIKQYNK